MKNRQNIFGCLMAMMGMMVGMLGCTDEWEEVGNKYVRPSDVICFTASLIDGDTGSVSRGTAGHLAIEQEEWLIAIEKDASRSAPVTSLEGSAGVIGYQYDENIVDVPPITGLHNKEFVFDKDELTAASADVRWATITKANVLFHVYAPYNISGGTLSAATATGVPTMAYTVDQDVTKQSDLIVASWEGKEGTNYGTGVKTMSIPLSFEHALTGVKFNVGFASYVTKLEIKGIYHQGTYTFGTGWTVKTEATTQDEVLKADYTFELNQTFAANAPLTEGNNTLMMIPQTLPSGAQVVLTYKENESDTEVKTIKATLAGKVWESGKMITYTIHKDNAPTTVYFDLAAGNVTLGTSYKGYVYANGGINEVTGTHVSTNRYYVYQSSTSNEAEFAKYTAASTGYATENDFNNKVNCRIPDYEPVPNPDDVTKLWRDYIVNNKNVEAVISSWYKDESSKTAGMVGRTGTNHYITVTAVANTSYDLVIDDIYSTFQRANKSRVDGGISFSPGTTVDNCVLTITTLGDNRLGNIHYYNTPDNFKRPHEVNNIDMDNYLKDKNKSNGSKIVFEGTGSLTVADVIKASNGFYANHYCAAIGGNDDGTSEQCSGIEINSGVLFAGSTQVENCSAIGGGGNGFGEVTINGGIVTAVAATTGTAIGGGIGFSSYGGEGRVYINGGNVYAYNLDNGNGIPSSAIGGAGSKNSTGTLGSVEITGGYVYAYSALGTAIGGGSSMYKVGGDANVTITGGQVIAVSGAGAGIGGGSAYTQGGSTNNKFNGGTATIKISGNPIIRTGSIGGGDTGDTNGKIGSANIEISGGDIQAQFVMAAGAKTTPKFSMSGGTIRNSHVNDEEYKHVKKQGGAVYLEDGKFTMTGGTIKNCSAEQGGAVYIARQSTEAMAENDFNFKMEDGTIHSCFATGDGGAVCIIGGQVQMLGGTIKDNYSQNGHGGAVYISNGNFFMVSQAATIADNVAQQGNGGGVFVSSQDAEVKVNLLQGSITGNTAHGYGGGVCVDMGETANQATVIVGAEGQGVTEADADPRISGNMAMMAGGGLYVRGTNAGITIHSGMIHNNDVSAYVSNENVANHLGEVTLNAGLVDNVLVSFEGNGGVIGDATTTDTQKIVKDTNSKLKANSFVRGGYNFNGWNTRADGKGTYYADESFIVASEPVTLYAQWKSQIGN